MIRVVQPPCWLPGRSPVLDAVQLAVLRGYGTERDVAAGEVLFADGDETYDLVVMLDGTAEIIRGYGQPGATLIAGYGRSQFLGEIGMLTGQRAYLTAAATSAGRILAVPAARLTPFSSGRVRTVRVQAMLHQRPATLDQALMKLSRSALKVSL